MIVTRLLKRALPFLLALAVGCLLARLGAWRRHHHVEQRSQATDGTHEKTWLVVRLPRSGYAVTNERPAGVTGADCLSAVFGADGTVTQVVPVFGDPQPRSLLTEQAVDAVRHIRFTPATVDGEPVALRALVQYDCSQYYQAHRLHYECSLRLVAVEDDGRVVYE
jgi:hypothetical protein